MPIWSNSWALGTQPTSFYIPSVGFPIKVITVYNNSPAQISFSEFPLTGGFPSQGITVPAGYPMNIAVSDWTGFAFITDGTAPAAKSSLVVIASGDPLGLSTALSLFGPSGWGAGASPSVLTAVNIGDPLAAWNINQLITFLTGGMRNAQNLSLANDLIWLDKNGGASKFFELNNSALLQWYATDAVTLLMQLTEAGVLSALTYSSTGRITSSATGLSAKPLQNTVIVDPPVTTVINGVDNLRHTTTINSLPASATSCILTIDAISGTVGDALQFFPATGTAPVGIVYPGATPHPPLFIPINTASTIGYQFVNNNDSVTLSLRAYTEAS